ncbi:caffeoylshikimate esterase-like [Oryza brachyantha]|uniref:caffeoylshikimate esterase-like n=1 Tax=Oryza brachyantha TaxID=4533 RepID=UPI001ADCB843|nr:caffeoylshikimate esterase-like [Oryza brachyantha]
MVLPKLDFCFVLQDQCSEDIKYDEEFIANSRGDKLFTCRWTPQKQAAKALIFICHGIAGECSISMRDTAARLVRAGYAVYGIDHEGHGRSSGRRCYVQNFSDIVTDCASYFTSICEKPENREKKRFLYGVSMGGSVALLLHRKDPAYWDGAVLLAPMCKISDDMRPHPIVVSALKMVCAVAPSWRIIPTPDIIDKVCKDPEMRKQVRSNPYIYRGNLPLKTCHELLMVSLDIEKNLHEVTLPFLVLHGGEDIVTDPSVSKLLYEEASSRDKTFKLYPGMWHALTAELPDDVEHVYSDIISWMDERAECTTVVSEMSGTPSA